MSVGDVSAGTVSRSDDITSWAWANRSTPTASASLTVPSGRPSCTTTASPCARLGSSDSVSPTVVCGSTLTGVS